MDRRNFLKSSTATAAVFAAGQVISSKASAKKSEPATRPQLSEAYSAVNKAAAECFGLAQPCIAHCQQMIAHGDTEMAKCLATTLNMSAICEATSKLTGLASADVANMKQVLSACASLCRTCAEACKDHVGHSVACKNCKESCERCADACEAAVKAA